MKKISDEQFQMLATQVWILFFGLTIGWAILIFKVFWWLPLFMIVMLIIARKLIHKVERKMNEYEQKSKISS